MKKLHIKDDTLTFYEEDLKNIEEVLKKSQLSIFNSDIVNEFQEEFLEFLNKKKQGGIVALPNCTSAILLALQMLDLQKDDEIISTNLTHSSSIYPIINLKECKIKVCDFEKDSYNINIQHLKKLISKKTKAMIVCYLHGYPFNISEIYNICRENNIYLIEDVAQGLGVKIGNLKAGNIGNYGCFSFGENKLLKMGEGGALKYNIVEEIEKINRLRHVGEVWKESLKSTVGENTTYSSLIYQGLDYKGIGFNYRVNPLNIALGIRQLKELEKTINERQLKLEIYKKNLQGIKGIKLIYDKVENTAPLSAWYLLDSNLYDVNKIILKCIELGIPVGKFKYKTISEIDTFKKYILNLEDKLDNSKSIQKNSIFFPLYPNISYSEVEVITLCLKEIFKNYKNININNEILKENIKYFDGFFIK